MMINIICPCCGKSIYAEIENQSLRFVDYDNSSAEDLGFIFGEEVNEDGSY